MALPHPFTSIKDAEKIGVSTLVAEMAKSVPKGEHDAIIDAAIAAARGVANRDKIGFFADKEKWDLLCCYSLVMSFAAVIIRDRMRVMGMRVGFAAPPNPNDPSIN